MKQAISFLLVGLLSLDGMSQDLDFLPHYEGYHHIEKQSLTQQQLLFSQFKPISRSKAAQLFVEDSAIISQWHPVFQEANEYFYQPLSLKKGLLGKFYKNEIDFFQLDQEDIQLRVNPVWQFQVGRDAEVERLLFINSRGLDVRGTIDNKISFHTRFLENQIEFPQYVKQVADTSGIIPYEGFWKEYNGSTTDFLRAFGSLNVNITPHLSAQVGYGRQFIGNGIRSMLLSDYANSYPYIRVDTEIWKFRYTNLFATLIADAFTYDQGTLGASKYPKKHTSTHFLDFAVTPKFHIGLFESIIFGQPDSIAPRQFQLEYVNPIIFYRAVEQQDGSSANALLGLTFQWNVAKRWMAYGQFVLDEMVISELTAGTGWWGNKYAYQLGIQGYDLFVPNMDVKLEYNMARPFTYAHQDHFTAYTHYRHSLAHPFGANFQELIGQIYYQPTPQLSFTVHGMLAAYGLDVDEYSSGKNPQRSYNDRAQEYGHQLLQGNRTQLRFFQARASYLWKYNLSLDLTGIFRTEYFEQRFPQNQSAIINLGFRWNMPYRNYLF